MLKFSVHAYFLLLILIIPLVSCPHDCFSSRLNVIKPSIFDFINFINLQYFPIQSFSMNKPPLHKHFLIKVFSSVNDLMFDFQNIFLFFFQLFHLFVLFFHAKNASIGKDISFASKGCLKFIISVYYHGFLYFFIVTWIFLMFFCLPRKKCFNDLRNKYFLKVKENS